MGHQMEAEIVLYATVEENGGIGFIIVPWFVMLPPLGH